jgi:hypothetical protein
MSIDAGVRRPMGTIVELTPDQAHTSADDLHFGRGSARISLTPLAQGTLTSVFSTIVAMSKKTKPTTVTSEKHEEQEKRPLTTELSIVAERFR